MKRWYYAVPLAAAGAFALACSDSPTSPGAGRSPNQPARTVNSVTGAAFTTTNPLPSPGVDPAGQCKNGNEAVNCNIYSAKTYVWLNGGPVAASLGDGTYFFAVLAPGGQGGNLNPNDGQPKNLSDVSPTTNTGAGDAYTNRTFTISGGAITYAGSHDFANNKIRLMGYDDTPNPGGVYIMAICSLGNGYPVVPSACKYDAFKVQNGSVTPGSELAIDKDAAGADTRTYKWQIGKQVDRTRVEQVGGTATFHYRVTATRDTGTIGSVGVSGTISVYNFNVDGSNNTVPVAIAGVVDTLSDGTACTVSGGSSTLSQVETDFTYTCALSALPSSSLNNKATVTWNAQTLTGGVSLDAGSADIVFTGISFTETPVDASVTVTDTFNGVTTTLGTVPPFDGGSSTTRTFTYSHVINIPSFGCLSYDNTATFTTNTTSTTGNSDKITVTVCGPLQTGALTMGFWQNKNGQGIITSGASLSNVCKSGTWLRQFHPFSDLSASATCAAVATYVYNVIKAANAGGTTMNPMLKAQMLATSLDVYFSDAALGGNRINAPGALGAVTIDLTKICHMIDGSGGGSCSGTFENVSSAFGGATSMTVLQMLLYQNTSDPVADAGANWYGQVKATQGLAKDAFDAINNQKVFGP